MRTGPFVPQFDCSRWWEPVELAHLVSKTTHTSSAAWHRLVRPYCIVLVGIFEIICDLLSLFVILHRFPLPLLLDLRNFWSRVTSCLSILNLKFCDLGFHSSVYAAPTFSFIFVPIILKFALLASAFCMEYFDFFWAIIQRDYSHIVLRGGYVWMQFCLRGFIAQR